MRFNQSKYPDAQLITGEEVENYLYAMLPERDEVLREMEGQAEKRDIPIVGPLVGRLFYQLGRMIGAKKVFEMGSAIGYSTIWWARAVGKDGRVVYTDGSAANAEEARGYLRRAGVANQVEVRVGDALELLSEQTGEFDVIFCDVDKEDYPRAFRLAKTRVRKGGLFVVDNVLWSGRVTYAGGNPGLQKKAEPGEGTRAIVELNQSLYQAADFYTTILPLRDGVAIAWKLS
ncbi:MAG TPA: O-methyltransferase [Terriglobales bacterium]|nr:O-methyltransferase [Terriglobales bacterium]